MANALMVLLISLSFLGLTISFGYFAKFLFDNPDMLDKIQKISAYYEVFSKVDVPEKSIELLRRLRDLQQIHGTKELVISRDGKVGKWENDKIIEFNENVLMEILSISDPKEITDKKKEIFLNIIVDIPITYLRPTLGMQTFGQHMNLAVTAEGIAFLKMTK